MRCTRDSSEKYDGLTLGRSERNACASQLQREAARYHASALPDSRVVAPAHKYPCGHPIKQSGGWSSVGNGQQVAVVVNRSSPWQTQALNYFQPVQKRIASSAMSRVVLRMVVHGRTEPVSWEAHSNQAPRKDIARPLLAEFELLHLCYVLLYRVRTANSCRYNTEEAKACTSKTEAPTATPNLKSRG